MKRRPQVCEYVSYCYVLHLFPELVDYSLVQQVNPVSLHDLIIDYLKAKIPEEKQVCIAGHTLIQVMSRH